VREFHRNRDGKVAEAVKQLQTAKLPTQYPRLCQDFPEYKQMRENLDDYEEVRKSLLLKVNDAARDRKFGADLATEGLFKVGTILEMTPEIFTQADQRFRRGDPPASAIGIRLAMHSTGKHCSPLTRRATSSLSPRTPIGLLRSTLQPSTPTFRTNGWRPRTGRCTFINDSRASSPSTITTSSWRLSLRRTCLSKSWRRPALSHKHISPLLSLRRFEDFTPAQLNAIASAYVNNPQLHWIIDDADVGDFLLRLSDRIIEMDSQLLRELKATIKKNAAEDSPLRGLAAEIDLRLF
jgi:hypothetical protein